MSYAGDLTPQQAWDLLTSDEGAVLVDVRTDAEWRYVGIPDAAAIGDRRRAGRVGVVPVGTAQPAVPRAARRRRRRGTVARSCSCAARGSGRSPPRRRATAAGLGPAYNVLEGFEGDVGPDGHRGHTGWRAAGLPWRQV